MSLENLPVEWSYSNLLNICDVKTGKVDANHAQENGLYNFFTCALEPLRANTYSFNGDLIILPGNGANVGHVEYFKGKIEAYQRTYVLHNFENVNSKYVFYHLKYLWKKINLDKQYGSATNYIKIGNFQNYKLEIAPLAEQQEIVRQLDIMLAQVEQIKARLDAIPAILKKFRQSVLADAVSGKLTEEWRGTSELIGWHNKTLGDIAIVKTGKTPSRKESKYWENASIPWLTSSATGNNFTDSADEFISDVASKECNLTPFPKGTLLLAMYGEGKTRGQVTELLIEATCNQACAAILVNKEIAHTSFVKIRLLENYEVIRKAASGGNQPNLNLNKVREIDISLPTLDEQFEIVNIVKSLFVYAYKIEETVQSAQKRVNLLTQSILAKAFSGKLTAEWREQHQELITGINSAESLLAKIQAEREANKPVKKARKAN